MILEQPQRRAGLVVRVSTDHQAANDEGSLKNQPQRLRQHVDYKRNVAGEEWRETAVYELKAISGKNSMRSQEFTRLFADIEAGRVNTVVCTALDRICRSVKDFLWFFEFLSEHHVEFVCLKQNYDTTTPQGKLFITIMMALAEFEREQTADRTREATNARSERGLWNGGRLLGYDPDPNNRSTIVPNEHEALAVNAAFDLYLETGSLRHTADALNRSGYREKSYTSRRGKEHLGGEFLIQHLQRLLKNRSYLAQKVVNKRYGGEQVVPAVWPAIVDREKFDAVQRLLLNNGYTRHNGAKETRHVHVLSGGLLVCGRCGSEMQGRAGTGKGGKVYFYYVCKDKECGLRVVANDVEAIVVEQIGRLAQEEGLLRPIVEQTNLRLAQELPALQQQRRALERQLAEVKASAGKLLDDWQASELVPARVFLGERLAELAQRRQDLETGIAQIAQRTAAATEHALDTDQVRTALSNIHAVYAELQPYERRELVRLVVHRIELGAQEMVLEINGGACTAIGETPPTHLQRDGVRERHEW